MSASRQEIKHWRDARFSLPIWWNFPQADFSPEMTSGYASQGASEHEFRLADFSGIGWSTSQGSTILPLASSQKSVNPRVVVVARPLSVAKQHNEVVFHDNPLEVDALTRIIVCQSPKVVDEPLLSIPYGRIMLNIGFPNVLLHRLLRFAMVEQLTMRS
jgi:hypothetical protein